MDVFRRLKIGLLPRVGMALGVVGLVPLVMAAVPLLRLNREAMTTQVLRTHSVAAQATADRFRARLETVRGTILHATSVALEAGAPVGAVFQELLASDGDLSLISLRDRRGEEVVRAQKKADAPVLAGLVATAFPPGVTVRRTGGRSWVLAGWSLGRDGLQVDAVIRAPGLVRLLQPEELGQDAEMAVIDRRGRLVLAGDRHPRPFPQAMVEQAAAGRTSGSGRFPLEDGRTVLGAWAPVRGTGWTVVSQQPASVAEAVARRAARRAAVALAVALALTLVLTGAAYRSLVRPLRRVLALQRQVAGLAPAPAEGDELVDLERSLRVLERRSKDRQEMSDVFLGRYRIVEVLGEGAMGTVFRAWDPKLRRSVALKTIRLGEVLPRRREEFIGRLMHEAVAAARLNHPNVVGVYDVVEHGEAAFLAMELVEGISLQKLLKVRKRLEPEEAAHIGRAVARALVAAHEAGLVHHDVKPGNILLGFDGEIKVTDFGIAKFVNEVTDDVTVVYGTPGYLPPETLQGEGYDELGDVFALGVILFQMLAGMLPRLTRSLQGSLAESDGEEAEPVAQYNSQVPEDMDRLIRSLLAVNRAKRLPSVLVAERRLDALIQRYGWEWTPPVPERGKVEEVVDASNHEHSRFLRTRVLRDGGSPRRGSGSRTDRGGSP